MKETCNLTNKSSGRVVYKIQDPECNVRRQLYPHQTMKNVKVSELEKLIQQPGGMTLFYNYLMVDDEEILIYLLNGATPAPEYWLTEDKIPSWMNTCTLDEFKDALDFAPEGTKDLIKKYAVAPNPLNDYSKRQAILDQLGFDVTKAIQINEASKKVEEEDNKNDKTKPAVQVGGRRSSTTSIVKPNQNN